jgi:septin 7
MAQTLEYRKRIPFAVVGSNQIKENPNERDRTFRLSRFRAQLVSERKGPHCPYSGRIRIREYAWGTVEVENLAHNDFVALRDLVIRKNLIDLIEVTKNVHYENFRVRQMSRMPKNSLDKFVALMARLFALAAALMFSNFSDPFTSMEQERKATEQKAEEVRNTKERIFRQKVSQHEEKIDERTAAVSAPSPLSPSKRTLCARGRSF